MLWKTICAFPMIRYVDGLGFVKKERGCAMSIHGSGSVKEDRRLAVLVVDDYVLARRGIRSMLEGYGDTQIVVEGAKAELSTHWQSQSTKLVRAAPALEL